MPTMKDVAKLAGVSHGTVSNVINGVKTVNHDTVIRVEQAMKQLGYRPDAKARSLRQKKTNTIGVVLPNLVDNLYSRFYTGAEEKLRGTGYSLTLCLTDDCPENELAALRRLQQQRVEAIVLISCQPDQKEVFDDLAVTGIPVVFVQRKPRALSHPVFVGTDLSESIYRAASSLLPHTPGRLCLLTGNPAFSCEEDAVRGFQQALTEAQRLWQKADLRHADHNKESAFRAAMWWLQSAQRPAVIFTTCGEHAKGVLAAIEMFQDPASPKTMVVSVENESWIQRAVPSYIHKIPQDFLGPGRPNSAGTGRGNGFCCREHFPAAQPRPIFPPFFSVFRCLYVPQPSAPGPVGRCRFLRATVDAAPVYRSNRCRNRNRYSLLCRHAAVCPHPFPVPAI